MITILILLLGITSFYLLIKRHYSKWQRLGFPTDEPLIPFGSLVQIFRKEKHFGLIMAELYEKFQEKVVGCYLFTKPALLVRDAELARKVLTTDFASFHDRGVHVDEKYDPLTANLFNLEGQKWHTLRNKLSPSFSSGKLKAMFETIDEVGNKLINYIAKEVEDGKIHNLEIKSLMTTYAVDIIGSVIFGLDIDSFTKPNNEFRILSINLHGNQKSVLLLRFRRLMAFIYPPLAGLLARLGIKDSVTYGLRDIIARTIEFRERHGIMRKDLLQLLIQLRNTGKISDDNDPNWHRIESTAENLKAMSIDMIAANAFLFYIAGSETTASTTSLTLYEMAMYPEVLAKAQKEVDDILKKHGLKADGCLTYEAIQDMKYLQMCVKETTRKYPGLPFLNCQCTKDYPVPDTKLVIPKGTGIIIPLLGIHRDPQHFPNPQVYKPERFAEETLEYNPVAYMPFGEGPRHCIAQRMGVLNTQTALAKILANFKIEPMPHKEIEFKFHTVPTLVPKDDLRVNLSKRW
ncbi:cytochrome P450 6d1 [Stomoxys calcitrans]|uniref:cytochrome P450 6d1 n=1 Tax=Stomoxys calcitrans TaxID=35570 RepID=UPI0027E376F1|nr:cytochrome P450 6d1 [Stomoxys calcitrans]